MKKSAVLLMGIIAMAGVLSGCGNSAGNAATETNAAENAASESTEGTEETEAIKEASGENVTISLLSWNNEELMGPYIEAFEKENPGIEVDLQFVPPVQQYVDKFMVLAASNQMTDMFYTAAENKEEVIEKGLAEDLSDMPIFDRINENTSATYGDSGKIYAYSPDAWVGGIFYNKDLFEKAGIKSEPKTWDEFLTCMEKLKAIGVEPYLDSAENVHNLPQDLYQSMIISKDPKNDDKINKGETTFKDQYTEAFSIWYNECVKPGLYNQISLGLNADQVVDMFVTGEVAMIHGGPWNIATFVEKNPEMKFDIFPLADKQGNCVLSGALNVGLSISAASPNKEACKKFIDFMAKDENILNWQKTTGNVIVVEGIDYELDTVINKFKEEAVDGNFYLPQIAWKNSAGIYKELLTGIQDSITGADTIENIPIRLDTKMKELSE